mgnify:CR=1 FL=1|tara:strand:- start:2756 stop:3028 length:273 start_codon:yes stop_codon:yes gene_type:complete
MPTNEKIQYVGASFSETNPHPFVRSFTRIGTYPIFYITKGFCILSAIGVEENIEACNDPDDDMFIVDHAINWESPDLHCDYTGEPIESAY